MAAGTSRVQCFPQRTPPHGTCGPQSYALWLPVWRWRRPRPGGRGLAVSVRKSSKSLHRHWPLLLLTAFSRRVITAEVGEAPARDGVGNGSCSVAVEWPVFICPPGSDQERLQVAGGGGAPVIPPGSSSCLSGSCALTAALTRVPRALAGQPAAQPGPQRPPDLSVLPGGVLRLRQRRLPRPHRGIPDHHDAAEGGLPELARESRLLPGSALGPAHRPGLSRLQGARGPGVSNR